MRRIILYQLILLVTFGLFCSCSKDNDNSNPNDDKGIELVEYISNPKACVINTDIFPTEETSFEIKIDLGTNPDFWMGCWDITGHPHRIVSRFFIYEKDLCYDFPDDWGGNRNGRTRCTLDLSKTNLHVIRFGNKYVHDLTTGNKKDNTAVSDFSVKAPFGLFGMIEYKGDNQPLYYILDIWSEVKIYYFRVYQNGNLIADMIPYKDPEGTICMYDEVRKRFFYRLDKDGNRIHDNH